MSVYRALLHLYPSSFRAEYGREMCAIFAEKRRDVSGPLALVAFWLSAVADVVRHAFSAHGDILVQDVRYTMRVARALGGLHGDGRAGVSASASARRRRRSRLRITC